MPKRSFNETFRRQVVEEILSGEQTMLGQSRRYEISRSVLHDWVGKYRSDGLASGRSARGLLAEQEARIAVLERKIGQLTMENDLLKKTSAALRQRNAEPPSVISGPLASASPKDAGR
jgi:transposase